MRLLISPTVRQKLEEKHKVTQREVEQCFENRLGGVLYDTRPGRATDPPTRWFVADTNRGRTLKVVYVQSGRDIYLKTAYEPNANELRIYEDIGLG